jgi:hypothetical protein
VVCLTCAIALGLGRTQFGDAEADAIERFRARLQQLRTDPGLRLYIDQIAREAENADLNNG